MPIPTLPDWSTTKYEAELEPMTKAGLVRPFAFTESRPHGEVVPTPRNPAEVIVVVPVEPKAAKFEVKVGVKKEMVELPDGNERRPAVLMVVEPVKPKAAEPPVT